MKERRRAIRVPVEMVLDVMKQNEIIESYRAAGVNLSLRGICIETVGDFKKSEKVLLKLNIPIDILGEIVWCKTDGQLKRYGVKFLKLGFINKISLKKYIKAIIVNKK